MKIVKISLLAALLVFSQCSGSKKSAKSTMPPPPSQNTSKKASIKDKTKNCRKIEGLFTIYSDTTTGDAYLVVKKDQLGKEFIFFSYAENGLVMTGHFRGAYRDNMVFRMEKVFDRVEFVKENTHFYFDPNNALSKAAEANISNSILLSEKIVAEDTSKGEYLLDANAIFLSEKLTRIKPTMPQSPLAAMMFNLGMLSKEKTKYGNLKSYPENTDVVVEYVYDNPSPINNGGTEVADARSVTLKIQHSFIEVPNNDFEPRMDDPRVGYFTQQVNDMTTPEATNYRDPIHRWHLVKKDPTAALSEPVEPIVWWIENTTPVEYRETIKKAGETWNRAFEKIGFKNAVRVEVQPDTASWDAGDIRYNVLRWTSSPTPPFGGYGPSFVNPRTGQILGADIMLEYIYVTNRMRQEKLFSTAGLEHLLLSDEEIRFPVNGNYCDAGMHMHHNTMFGLCGMLAMNASQEKKDEFLHQSLYYLVLHEMGHTLGLNHNMKSSQLFSPEELADRSKVEKYGLIGSVMDYPATNFRLDPAKQTNYFTDKPGPYDDWAIEYGYSASTENPAGEKERLERILARSTEPALTFGNDADDMRAPGKAIDPRVNVNDLSNDAISYSIERMQLSQKMLDSLKAKYTTKGKSYHELKTAYFVITSEYVNAASAISRYIGGVYVDRAMAGQQGATQPYTPVKYEDQKRAMKALSEHIFSAKALGAPNTLYNYLQSQRRGFNFFSTTEDPKIHERVELIQEIMLDHLLHPNVMGRLTNSRLYGNKYSVNEMVTDLTDAVFKDDINGSVNTFRQNLQITYVTELANIINDKNRYDNISKSAVLSNMNSIMTQMKLALTKGDAETKAHRQHLIFIIEKALDKE